MNVSKESKPGWRTTEFWVTVIGAVYLFLNTTGAVDELPKSWSSIALAIIGGAYAVSRGIAKQGIPYDPPAPGTTSARKPG